MFKLPVVAESNWLACSDGVAGLQVADLDSRVWLLERL